MRQKILKRKLAAKRLVCLGEKSSCLENGCEKFLNQVEKSWYGWKYISRKIGGRNSKSKKGCEKIDEGK